MNAMIRALPEAKSNQLLAGLPAAMWESWYPQLERVALVPGTVLFEPGEALAFVVFPTTAVVSLIYITRDGDSSEVAVVGNEGAVGLELFMGGRAAQNQAVVQSAGEGYRLRAAVAVHEVQPSRQAMGVFLRFIEALMAQVAQNAMCNRYHSVEQQLCRRLLQGMDRSRTEELLMTQEMLSRLLGVRREA